MFNSDLNSNLYDTDKVLCDHVYVDRPFMYLLSEYEGISGAVLTRHETLKKRIRQFNVFLAHLGTILANTRTDFTLWPMWINWCF